MQIDPLVDHPGLAPILARWHGDEWEDLRPHWGYQAALDELRSHTNRDAIPFTLVALDGDLVLGSVSLIVEDLPGWEHLTPWLASVFVAPDARGRGVGTAMVEYAAQFASRLGITRLHLFTGGQEDFYRRLGWTALAASRLRDHDVLVMIRELR